MLKNIFNKLQIWKLNKKIRAIQRDARKREKVLKRNKAPSEDFQYLDSDVYSAIQDIEQEIDRLVGTQLFHEARSLDVATPTLADQDMWVHEDGGNRVWFTPKARAQVRRLIDEEKARRFDIRTLWVTKLILPIFGWLVAIIGALTGLIAIMKHKP